MTNNVVPFTRQNPPTGFYTYAYLREDGRPYYVGKGKGTRAWDRHGALGKYWMPPADDRVLILKWGLEQQQAFDHEIYLIAVYGNFWAGGWLNKNFDEGGLGATGSRHSEEFKQRQRERGLGRRHTAEAKAKMKASAALRDPAQYRKTAEAQQVKRRWFHAVHGERFCSAAELAREFQDVEQGNLSKLVKGSVRIVYGWTCLTPDRQFVPVKPEPKTVTWAHAELGEFTGTAKELCAAFPGLYNTALNRVLRGVSNHHGGWTIAAA